MELTLVSIRTVQVVLSIRASELTFAPYPGTQKIQKISYQHKGQTVTLIDTPGFDDSDDIQRSDADILNDIATFLQKSYDAGQLLTGVIWLQSIATIRSGGSERRRARLFKKILGENAYKRVVIATTMWSKICDDDHGMKQMEQRQSQVWHDMIDQDALVTRHDDNKASADKIIEHLLSTSKSKPLEPLQIQTELARDGKLCNTSAGQQLDNDLGDMIKKLSKDLDNLRRERDASKAEIEELQVQINRVENERFSLRRYAVGLA